MPESLSMKFFKTYEFMEEEELTGCLGNDRAFSVSSEDDVSMLSNDGIHFVISM